MTVPRIGKRVRVVAKESITHPWLPFYLSIGDICVIAARPRRKGAVLVERGNVNYTQMVPMDCLRYLNGKPVLGSVGD